MQRTAEAVSLGHPDKVADYISSYILDRLIEQDPQVKLFQMYMRENQKLGAQLDIALEALSKCADNKLLSAIVNKALVEIIKIGETTKGGDNE